MAKTSLKTHAVLKFIALIPWRSICQMLANFYGLEFYRTVSNKEKNRFLVFTPSREREIRQFHVVAVQQRQINVQISVHVLSFVLLI